MLLQVFLDNIWCLIKLKITLLQIVCTAQNLKHTNAYYYKR